MKKAITALGILILVIGSSNALALPISGEIYFLGSATVTGTTTDTSGNVVDIDPYDLANATGVSFDGVVVESATGDFATAGVGFLDLVAFNDFTWDPVLTMADSSAPMWSVNGFTFDLNSLVVTEQSASQLALAGSGVLRYNGGDDTLATWTLSGDTGGSRFIFTSVSASVPEPASLGLLGIGLLGLGFAKRRNKA